MAAVAVEPPEIAVARIQGAGRGAGVDPRFRQDPRLAPLPATLHQQPDPGMVAGRDEQPAAPVGAARYRAHRLAAAVDPGGDVAGPAPAVGGPDPDPHPTPQH